MATINCKGKLIDLTTPRVMGILNSTPDSFYDGGKLKTDSLILNQVAKMVSEGATFIDIGGQSSRPNAEFLSPSQELQRVAPIVEIVLKENPELLISMDTFHSEVADVCLQMGACMINDISAGALDQNMFEVVAQHQVPYVMMHMKGTPQNMQQQTEYKDLVKEVLFYFSEKIAKARSLGINDVIIDPGFGFAKTLAQNFELLNQLELLHITDLPILVGVSRKSMIYKTLETTAQEALNGTTVLNTIALTKGASILRVHDVKEAVESVRLFQTLKR